MRLMHIQAHARPRQERATPRRLSASLPRVSLALLLGMLLVSPALGAESEASPDTAATLGLAEARFPEFFQAEAPSAEAARLGANALRVTLPEEADGVMEVSSRGYRFQVREEGRGREPLRASGGAAFYGPQRFWKPVGASSVEGERQWRTQRVEEFLVLAEARGTHRARYVVTVPEGVSQVRDAGGYLEFLEASGKPVVRMHTLLARDGAGLSRQGEVRLLGARALEDSASRELRRYALEGRTLVVEMSIALEGLTGPVVIDPAWSSTGVMSVPRYHHTATMLPSGKVLVTGGGNGSTSATSTAELYDPASGTWSATGSTPTAHQSHTATLLASGKVLVVGGYDRFYDYNHKAELYDPATETWTPVASPLRHHLNHTATLLASGKVLVAGDPNSSGTTELYDPATGTWTRQGAPLTPRRMHGAVLLPSGQVLIAGGLAGSSWLSSAELYDPATGSFSATGSMAAYHTRLVALPSGKVLALGGSNTPCELYDPATGTWSSTGKLLSSIEPMAVVLDSGQVLVVMGSQVELYDPATGAWRRVGSLQQTRTAATLTPLPSGRALVVGGGTASAEVFNPDNFAPVAQDSASTTSEDKAVTVPLRVTDVDEDALTYTVVSPPANGTYSLSASVVVYTPAPNFHGTDSFTFKASDGVLESSVVTVSLTVTPVNDTPVSQALSTTTLEDTPISLTLLATDVDGDALTYTMPRGPTKGTLSGTAPHLLYTPHADANGTDSFTFVANDGKANSSTAVVTLTLTPVNDAPVASDFSRTGDEDTPLSLTLAVTDVDGNRLTYSVVQGPTKGTLSGTAPDFTYTPPAGFHGTDSFTFKAHDGQEESGVATASLTVMPVNDVPQAMNLTVWTEEDTAVPVVFQGTDVDGDALTYTVIIRPRIGTLSGTPPHLVYTPDPNTSGQDSFFYEVSDGRAFASALVVINIAAVNDAPVALPGKATTPEDTAVAVRLGAVDMERNPMNYHVVQGPAHGKLSGTEPRLTYTPDPDFHGTDSFTFKADDARSDSNVATFSLTVTPENDAPTARDLSVETLGDTEVAVVLAATDVEGDGLTYTVVTPPAHGTLSGTAPDLTYTPHPDFSGTDSFTFKANDGKLDSNEATVSLTAQTGGCGCSGASTTGAAGLWGMALLVLGLASRRRVGSARDLSAMRHPLTAHCAWALLVASLVTVGASASAEPVSEPPPRIPAAELQEDLAVLKQAYEQLHPGLYRYNDKARMEAHFAALKTELGRDLSLQEAYLAFSLFLAKIQCGHSYANFYNQPKAIAAALFQQQGRVPFYFRWISRRMIVTRNFSGDARLVPGTEVLAIDGTPVPAILDTLLQVARADGSNEAKRVSYLEVGGHSQYEAFDLYFPMFFPRTGSRMVLRLKTPDGKPLTLETQALTYEQRVAPIQAEVEARRGDGPIWEFKFLDARTGYLRMPTWSLYNSKWDWKGFLDTVFEQLAARKAAHLVIDLRGNEGGSSVGNVILGKLATKDLTLESFKRRVRYRKVPEELAPYLDTWDPSFKDWGEDAVEAGEGFYRLKKYDDAEGGTVIQASARPFKGKTWVLVDASNSSATFEFALALRQHELGTLVGQPTGGNQRGINGGAFFFLRLPRSKIEIDLPLIGFFPSRPMPDAGLVPDISITPRAQDIARGVDTELEALKKRLRASR